MKKCDLYVLAAIDGSIRKWKGIVHQNNKNHGADDCPLCVIFNTTLLSNNIYLRCYRCPITFVTMRRFCVDTPYGDFINKPRTISKTVLANKELTFLYEVRLDFVRRMIHDKTI